MTSDEIFMQRALELAQMGIGFVSPNPRVGCVIVHGGKIIGEGWHQKYGEGHAEVHAIDSVKDKSLLKDATVYVNLEPCSHYGNTPPCADLLVQHRIKKVVVANIDPNPIVKGRGIKKMQEAQIDVVTGILEKEGINLNRRFFTSIEKQEPYVILKWAQTADRFIARKNFDSKWISNEVSRQLVHRWRSEEDAVLVGTNTAAHDNPQLNVRNWSGRDPIRIVIDRFLKLPNDLNLWDSNAATICYNTLKDEIIGRVTFIRLPENDFIKQLLGNLFKRRIQSVIIEGGATTLQLFIDAGYWDEARIFFSPNILGEGISAPVFKGNLISSVKIFSDELKIYHHG